MKLLDRYLSAVRQSMFLTPGATRDDILRELEEEIRAELDEKAEELERPLTEAEADGILQRFGHPLLVAGRYREGSGAFSFGYQLIGPELFPLYRLILAVNLSLTATVLAIILIWRGEFGGIGGFLPHLGLQALIITGIFMAAEAGLRRSVRRGWSMLTTKDPENRVRISRFHSVVEMIITIVFANIWIELPLFTDRMRTAHATDWSPGPVWNHFHGTFFIPILVVMIVSIALSFVNLIDPYRRPTKLWISAMANLAFAGMIAASIFRHWAVLTLQFASVRSDEALPKIQEVVYTTNLTIALILGVFGLVALCQAIYEIVKAVQLRGGDDVPNGGRPRRSPLPAGEG